MSTLVINPLFYYVQPAIGFFDNPPSIFHSRAIRNKPKERDSRTDEFQVRSLQNFHLLRPCRVFPRVSLRHDSL